MKFDDFGLSKNLNIFQKFLKLHVVSRIDHEANKTKVLFDMTRYLNWITLNTQNNMDVI